MNFQSTNPFQNNLHMGGDQQFNQSNNFPNNNFNSTGGMNFSNNFGGAGGQMNPNFQGGGNMMMNNNNSQMMMMGNTNMGNTMYSNNAAGFNNNNSMMMQQQQQQIMNQSNPNFQSFGDNLQRLPQQQQQQQPFNQSFNPQSFGGQVSPMIMEELLRALSMARITNLWTTKSLPIGLVNQQLVVQLPQFKYFLEQILMLNPNSANQIAQAFLLNQSGQFGAQNMNYLIDFVAFENSILKSSPPTDLQNKFMNVTMHQQYQQAFEILKYVHEQLRQKMLFEQGSLLSFFQKADRNGDSFIQKEELAQLVQNIGVPLNSQQLDALLSVIDKNGDGRISYYELCNQFADLSNAKAVIDKSFWGFYIFQNIRNLCSYHNKTLGQLFKVNIDQFKGLGNNSIKLPQDHFLRCMSEMGIILDASTQQKLLNFLQTSNAMQGMEIDFLYFSELVGVDQFQEATVNTQGGFKSENNRLFFRQMIKYMNTKGLNETNLQVMLNIEEERNLKMGQIKLNGLLDLNFFVGALLRFNNQLDQSLIREVAQRFQKDTQVNYNEFLNTLKFEVQKYNMVNTVFACLQAALGNFGASSLRQLFENAYPQFKYNSQIDAQTIDQVLKRGSTIPPRENEIQVIIREYSNNNGMVDFDAFDRDFRDFIGQAPLPSASNPVVKDFNTFLKGNGNTMGGGMPLPVARQQSPQVQEALKRIANYHEQNMQSQINDIFIKYQINQMSGAIQTNRFQTLLSEVFFARPDDIHNLIAHYDNSMRGEFRVQAFLEDLKELMSGNMQKRLEIISLVSKLGEVAKQQVSEQNLLMNYAKEIADVYKGIQNSGRDVFQFFSQYSKLPGRISLKKQDFAEAMISLDLQKSFTDHDIDQFFAVLDKTGLNVVEIDSIDKLLKKFLIQEPKDQILDNILEAIANIFNGDTQFLHRELMKLDQMGIGMIDTSAFIQFMKSHLPEGMQIASNDLIFISKQKYESNDSMRKFQVPRFTSDLKIIINRKGIKEGTYNMHMLNNKSKTRSGGVTPGDFNITPGNNNPLLGMGSRNTRHEQLNPHSDQQRAVFTINIEDRYFEDLVRATYLRGESVYQYFTNNASRDGVLLPNTFGDSIRATGTLSHWNINVVNKVFTQIDSVMNRTQQGMGQITAAQIDEAVNLGCKKTIQEIQNDILKAILSQAISKNVDLKTVIKRTDPQNNHWISVDNFCKIVLDDMKTPITRDEIRFLSKKYVNTLPNVVSYEQMIEDFEMMGRLQFQGMANFSNVCSYIRKACIAFNKITDTREYFRNYCLLNPQGPLLTKLEFTKACRELKLVPDICQEQQISALFDEMDTAKTSKITMDQINNFINKVSQSSTEHLQFEVLDQIALKMTTTQKDVILANIFKAEDPKDLAKVPEQSFINVVMSSFKGVNVIDVKLIAKRYEDRGQINYKKFIQDVQQRAQNVSGMKNDKFGLQPGMYGQDPSSDVGVRLKSIIRKINDFTTQRRIELGSRFQVIESASGLIKFDLFYQEIKKLAVTDLSTDDIMFLCENYLKVQTSVNPGLQKEVDYRKFLQDLKLHGVEQKSSANLTVDQKKALSALVQSLKAKNALDGLVSSLFDSDIQLKGYLPSDTIISMFHKNQVRDISDLQFRQILEALESNSRGEKSYKELLELIVGNEKAQQMFADAMAGNNRGHQKRNVQFIMPLQILKAQSQIMGQIGTKLIRSGKNYEDEFKSKIGEQIFHSEYPSCSQQHVFEVLSACIIQQQLTNDERTTLQAYLNTVKDARGNIPIMTLLPALGLPPQTVGPRGGKAAPKRILSLQDRQRAQQVIFAIRKQLNTIRKTPEEFFDKLKTSPADISTPVAKFNNVLRFSPELGAIGSDITDDLVSLLMYYLEEDIPGEISFKKLYLAFVLTDKQEPLQQHGGEEIKKYSDMVRDQAGKGTPMVVLELLHFMSKNHLTMPQVFKIAQAGAIQRVEFEKALNAVGFKSKDMNKLVEVLDPKGNRMNISLDRLQEYMKKAPAGKGPGGAPSLNLQQIREQYSGFNPKVKAILQKISDSLKSGNVTLKTLFEKLDANSSGTVDREEFVYGLMATMNLETLKLQDYSMLFAALDLNNQGHLSLNQFGLFLEGAKISKLQRMNELDAGLVDEMRREAESLFKTFDQNGDGVITADEIMIAFKSMGRHINLEEAQGYVRQVDQNGDGRLDHREFVDMMVKQMKEEMLSQEDNIDELRAHFLNADIDHSGTLGVNEIYSVLLRMGVDLTLDELIELMNEIDVDRNGSLDIDEFIALVTVQGDDVQFQSENTKKTLQQIKKCRRLKPSDFMRLFKQMPATFVNSFVGERWKNRKNMPSSAFMPQIDPKNMLYKDLMPLVPQALPANIQAKKTAHPKLKPLNVELSCEITFDEATGVPLPSSQGFDRSQIIKRAVRVCLYDSLKKEFYANTTQVSVLYQGEQAEDVWKFPSPKDLGLNPVLFRAANEYVRAHCFLVFEFVIYVKLTGAANDVSKVNEMSCGWCSLEIKDPTIFQRQSTFKLQIHGGSPQVNQQIDAKDVHVNRTGLKYSIQGIFNSKIESQLIIEIRSANRLDDDVKHHMSLLPQTCFLPRHLLFFVSGFRNILAARLLRQQTVVSGGNNSTFRQPEGDSQVVTFSYVMDCPDIYEALPKIWTEDYLNAVVDKMNTEQVMAKTKECLMKIYPITYADEFSFNLQTLTESAIGDQYVMRKREELLISALRFGLQATKQQSSIQQLESLSAFRPFTIREQEFDVWYSSAAKNDQILQKFGENGLIKPPTPINNNNQQQFGGASNMFSTGSVGSNPALNMYGGGGGGMMVPPSGLDQRNMFGAQRR